MIRKFLLPLLLLSPLLSHAEIYKWVDNEGNVHFGDRPPPKQNAEAVTVRPNTYQSVTIGPFEAFERGPSVSANSVVMYSTTWCGVCKKAKQYFKVNNIPFEEYDVEKTARGRADYAKLKGRGVPIILVGDQRMNGFSVKGFEKLYKSGR